MAVLLSQKVEVGKGWVQVCKERVPKKARAAKNKKRGRVLLTKSPKLRVVPALFKVRCKG